MCKYFGLLLVVLTFSCQAELTDPTRPANFDPATITTTLAKSLSLDAIFYSPTEQHAIINGQTLHQGDTIAGYRLLQIKPQAVIVKGPNGTFELPLLTLQIKRTATDGMETQ